MIIHINTANGIQGSADSNAQIEKKLMHDLDRFKDRITRLEVHFHDENAAKGGDDDKGCMIEARLAGKQPISVNDRATTLVAAINGASQKMINQIETILGREADRS